MAFRQDLLIAAMVCGLASSPAAGQLYGTEADHFVDAVRQKNATHVTDAIKVRPTLVNSRDYKGDTALTIAIARRDEEWTLFLLTQGADPNASARNGDTPLIVATRLGFTPAATQLLARKAKVDGTNKKGETALIIAVQQRNPAFVKMLLADGADPDKTDSVAGYSARDYAKRDPRAREILRLIENRKPKP